MLDYLYDVEQRLFHLLNPDEDDQWNSLMVTYEHPHVERLWRQEGENRIYLHRIHPCNEDQAFYHPHPWASAMRVLDGKYRMKVGVDGQDAAELILTAGSCYSMTQPRAMHSVQPIGSSTLSLMVTGPKWAWDTNVPTVKHEHRQLTESEKTALLADVWRMYSLLDYI